MPTQSDLGYDPIIPHIHHTFMDHSPSGPVNLLDPSRTSPMKSSESFPNSGIGLSLYEGKGYNSPGGSNDLIPRMVDSRDALRACRPSSSYPLVYFPSHAPPPSPRPPATMPHALQQRPPRPTLLVFPPADAAPYPTPVRSPLLLCPVPNLQPDVAPLSPT